MRRTVNPALLEYLDLRDRHRFNDHELRRVINCEDIHKAMMKKNFGNETFKIVVMGTKGKILGVVEEDEGVTRFKVKE